MKEANMSIFWNKMTKIARMWTLVVLINNIINQIQNTLYPVTPS
jgi:hypothetical protein